MRAQRDAVWITGLGLATSLGSSFEALSASLLAGRSGVSPVTHFDAKDQPCQIAASLGRIVAPEGFDLASFSQLGPWKQLLIWCSVNALRDSGWWERRSEVRIGLIVGIGAESILLWEEDRKNGGTRIQESSETRPDLATSTREMLGLNGPSMTVAAACASGNLALMTARSWVARGWVDVCLVGACDRSLTPMGMAGFGNLGALTKRNDAPEAASRPFDRNRDGFVMGEGGAMFVVEPARFARKRGARVYGEIAGVGSSSDAHHLVIPSPDIAPCVRAMRSALADAQLNLEDLDYINAHATSTPVGDVFETKALREVLGEHIRNVPVSATKSMTGHLLGATSAVEALACLTAFDGQAIPPTINLVEVDPECDLCHVANEAREAPLRTAMSNSFGFGGSNICVVFRKVG